MLLASALAAGIVCDRYWALCLGCWCLPAVAALLGWLVLWQTRNDRLASSCLLVSTLALGGIWHHTYWRLYRADEIGWRVNADPAPCLRRGDCDHFAPLGTGSAANAAQDDSAGRKKRADGLAHWRARRHPVSPRIGLGQVGCRGQLEQVRARGHVADHGPSRPSAPRR